MQPSGDRPSIDQAAELCNAIALVMSRTSREQFVEPDVISIANYDSEHGDADIPDPLLTTHYQIRFLLQCAGDFVYSIGKLLQQDEPMVMTPAIVARSAAEYAAMVWYLTQPSDTAGQRVSRMARLLHTSFLEYGVTRPEATDEERGLLERLQRWSAKQNLGKAPKFQTEQVLDQMEDDRGSAEYNWLSSYVHGSAATVMQAHIFAAHDRRRRELNAWRHAMYACALSLNATHRVTTLWSCDQTELVHVATLYHHYARWLNEGARPE